MYILGPLAHASIILEKGAYLYVSVLPYMHYMNVCMPSLSSGVPRYK